MYLSKRISTLVISLFITTLGSCGNLPPDIHPNPADSGYHRMEFDIATNGSPVKEIGIGNINLIENQSLENVYFKFYGIYKGTLHLKSNACGINSSVSFDGEKTFYLKDLILKPTKCSIELVAETSEINKKQHNIVETGVIKINVIPNDTKPVSIEYSRVNAFNNLGLKTYSWLGQGSIQRQEGDLTLAEEFTVKTGLLGGGIYRIAGCTPSQSTEGSFDKSDFQVRIKDVLKKEYLYKTDTCDLEIRIIPNEIPNSMVGRFSYSVYDKNAVVLENLDWKISKSFGKEKLNVSGQTYVLACSINGVSTLKNSCSSDYNKDVTYWIRAVTLNGRKSIFALKNSSVFWTE